MSIMEDFSLATFDEKIRFNQNPCRQKCGVRKLYEPPKEKKNKVRLIAEKFGLWLNGGLVDGFTEEQVLKLGKAPKVYQTDVTTGKTHRVSAEVGYDSSTRIGVKRGAYKK
jgi:hypothetical protein